MVALVVVGVDGDEVVFIELLGIDDRLTPIARHIGEDFEEGSHPHVVAVAGDAEADMAGSLDVVLEGFDPHAFTDLGITQDGHATSHPSQGWVEADRSACLSTSYSNHHREDRNISAA